MKDSGEISSGKAGTALIVPLWFVSGFHHAILSALNQEEEYEALNFVAAWSLGQRAYSIPTLGLPPFSQIIEHDGTASDDNNSKRDAPSWLPTAASTYAALKKIGDLSEEILSKLPPVKVEKVAADIHVVPKFCKGLSVLYTPHKSAPCTCTAVEVIAETSKEGIGKPLSIKPVEKVVPAPIKSESSSSTTAKPATADRTEKGFSVADRLNKVLSFIDSKYKKKVPIEIDSEYTRSTDSLKLLISSGWEFTTRIRHDSLIGREVRDCMQSNSKKLDLYGKWYNNNQEYGGGYQIIGRRITRHNSNKIILYLSTRKNLSAQQVIDERSTRWRIENFFKNVDVDSTPGNNVNEITGYYTLAFFMAELSIAFKATTKTVGLIMNREGQSGSNRAC